jgi:ribosomal protein S18 acetylase RimI-like enzyme
MTEEVIENNTLLSVSFLKRSLPLRARYDTVSETNKREIKMDKEQRVFTLKKATDTDTEDLMHIYNEAKTGMKEMGIDQWREEGEPNRDTIQSDLLHHSLWVLKDEQEHCIATASIIDTRDPDYADDRIKGAWINTENTYLAIHRVAILPFFKGQRLTDYFMQQAEEEAQAKQRKSIRIDTHNDNKPMQKWIARQGFSFCGTITISFDGTQRNAYEKML